MNLTLRDMTVRYTNQVTITGIPNSDANKFIINIGNGEEDIALNFNVSFALEKIIIKTWYNGKDDHEKVLDRLPFVRGQEFKVTITFTRENFTIKMPGGYNESYPNYSRVDNFSFIQVLQDVRIKGFNID